VWWVTNYHRCVRWQKKFFVFSKDHDQWPSFIYIRGDLMCDGSRTITDVWDDRKFFFVFSRDHEHCDQWPYFIYKRRPNVWRVTNYHRCVRWQKKFFVFSKDHDQWPSFIYIRGDLMCDGSPTIIDVWDARKNFLCFPWSMNMVTSDHLLYIY
jgi:hypothetical protein